MWVLETLWEIFKMYLGFLWPPNAYHFLRNWRVPMSGQGLGPGIYTLFLPVMWSMCLLAIATHLGLVVGLSYLATGLEYTR